LLREVFQRQRDALSPLPFRNFSLPFQPWQLCVYRLSRGFCASLLHLTRQLQQWLLHVKGHKKHLYQAQNLPFRLQLLRLTPTLLLPAAAAAEQQQLLLSEMFLRLSEMLLRLLQRQLLWRRPGVFCTWVCGCEHT
jgi:hypothetical protein